MKRFSLFFALSFVALVNTSALHVFPAYAKTKPALVEHSVEKVFNAKSYQLENGLQIVVVENHRVPVVTHMVWYRVGAADESPGKSGIAHFLEHLMFKGQSYPGLGDIAAGDFSKTIRALGGEDNAFTSQDYTAYFQSISSDQLETVMRMEAGRMRGLKLTPDDVFSENKVILEERRQRIDNDPRALFEEQMNEVLFANHPYDKPVIGWFHEMATLGPEDAKAFYDRWYAPNNAILVVSGDVTGEQVLDLAKKTYGIIPAMAIPERKRPASPPFIARASVQMTHPVVQEPVFQREYRVPSYRQSPKDSLALQVLEEILGGGPSSRFYKSLVIDQKIATSASLSYTSQVWDDGSISVSLIPSTGHTLDQGRNAIDRELRKLINEGVSALELKEAITRLQAEAIYARDSVAGPAMIIGYSLATGASLEDIESWPSHIEQVTADEIKDVASRFLDPDKPSSTPPVDGYLYPLVEKKSDLETTTENGTKIAPPSGLR